MNWRELYKKLTKPDSQLSTVKLMKQRRFWRIGGFAWLMLGLFFAVAFLGGLGNRGLETYQELAVLGAGLGSMGMCFAMYAQYRVLEAECSFELRLREALAESKEWQA